MIKRIDKSVLLLLIVFTIISIITVYASEILLADSNNYYIKQIIWYIIGYFLIFLILKIGNEKIYKYTYPLYFISNIMLILLLLFAPPINEAKCWFKVNGIGTIQPSEFMKISLIITLSYECSKYKEKYKKPSVKDEFMFLLKIMLIIIPPTILTFLEPDTGVVLIYLIITMTILFVSGIRYRWFIILAITFISIIAIILGVYFFNQKLFISLFGNSFFLRINRLLDWSNKEGYQLINSMTSIGSAGLLGHGFNIKLYIPEAQTDFIFAVFSSCFGLIGSIILLLLLVCFDIKIIKIGFSAKKNIDKYIISGVIGMLIYQQFQNIGMTIGIMPITGITLPFISYGGSSLLSYMIMIALVLNISKT
ncbi:MAG: FtsW/RodA/SpoVE family cell cycle protein [Bacilli bacterium]|nr:FtsW/RodA/SpoVE family cell cycle protein [Bacilli bacterium]